jgi:hypothetical protein
MIAARNVPTPESAQEVTTWVDTAAAGEIIEA